MTGSRSAWRHPSFVPALLLSLLIVLIAVGCGDGDSGASAEGDASTRETQQSSLASFGSEVDGAQARQAEARVDDFLEAKAAGKWEKACAELADPIRHLLGRLAARSKQIDGTDCADYLEASAERPPGSQRDKPFEITALAVRVDGENGYVLYKDATGDEYALAIRLEGDRWKVAGVGGTPLS